MFGAIYTMTSATESLGGNIIYKGIPDSKAMGIAYNTTKSVFREGGEKFVDKGTRKTYIANKAFRGFTEAMRTTTVGNVARASREEGIEEFVQGWLEELTKSIADYQKFGFQDKQGMGFHPESEYSISKTGFGNVMADTWHSAREANFFVDQAIMGAIGGFMFSSFNAIQTAGQNRNLASDLGSFNKVASYMIRNGEEAKLKAMINSLSNSGLVSKNIDTKGNFIPVSEKGKVVSQNEAIRNSLLEQVELVKKVQAQLDADGISIKVAGSFADEGIALQSEIIGLNDQLDALNAKEEITDEDKIQIKNLEKEIAKKEKKRDYIFTKEEGTEYSKKYNDYVKDLYIGTSYAKEYADKKYSKIKDVKEKDITRKDRNSKDYIGYFDKGLKSYGRASATATEGLAKRRVEHNERTVKASKEAIESLKKDRNDLASLIEKGGTKEEYSKILDRIINHKTSVLEGTEESDIASLDEIMSMANNLISNLEGKAVEETKGRIEQEREQGVLEQNMEMTDVETEQDYLESLTSGSDSFTLARQVEADLGKVGEAGFRKEATLDEVLFGRLEKIKSKIDAYNQKYGNLDGYPDARADYRDADDDLISLNETLNAVGVMSHTNKVKDLLKGSLNGSEEMLSDSDRQKFIERIEGIKKDMAPYMEDLAELNGIDNSEAAMFISKAIRTEMKRKFLFTMMNQTSVKDALGDDYEALMKDLRSVEMLDTNKIGKEVDEEIIFLLGVTEDAETVNKVLEAEKTIERIEDALSSKYEEVFTRKNVETVLELMYGVIDKKDWYSQNLNTSDDDFGNYNHQMFKLISHHNNKDVTEEASDVLTKGLNGIVNVKFDDKRSASGTMNGSQLIMHSFMSWMDSLAISNNDIHNILEDIYKTHSDDSWCLPLTTEQRDLLKFTIGAHIGRNKGFNTVYDILMEHSTHGQAKRNRELLPTQRAVYIKGSYGSGKTTVAAPYFVAAMQRLNPSLPDGLQVNSVRVITDSDSLRSTFRELLDAIAENEDYDVSVNYYSANNYEIHEGASSDLIIWDEAGLTSYEKASKVLEHYFESKTKRGIAPFVMYLGDKSQMQDRRYRNPQQDPLFALRTSTSMPLTKVFSTNIEILQELADRAIDGRELSEWKYIEREDGSLSGTQQFGSVEEVISAFKERLDATKDLDFSKRPVIVLASEHQPEMEMLKGYEDYVYTLTPDTSVDNPKVKSIQGLRKPMVFLAFNYNNIENYSTPGVINFLKSDSRATAYTGITRASQYVGLVGPKKESASKITGLEKVEIPVRDINEAIDEEVSMKTSEAEITRFAPNAESNPSQKKASQQEERTSGTKKEKTTEEVPDTIEETGAKMIFNGEAIRKGQLIILDDGEYRMSYVGTKNNKSYVVLTSAEDGSERILTHKDFYNKIQREEVNEEIKPGKKPIKESKLRIFSEETNGNVAWGSFSSLVANDGIMSLSEQQRDDIRTLHFILGSENRRARLVYSSSNTYEDYGETNSVEHVLDVEVSISQKEIKKLIEDNNLTSLKGLKLTKDILKGIMTVSSLAQVQVSRGNSINKSDLENKSIEEIANIMRFDTKEEIDANIQLLKLYKAAMNNKNKVSNTFTLEAKGYYLASRAGNTSLESLKSELTNKYGKGNVKLNVQKYKIGNLRITVIKPVVKLGNGTEVQLNSDIYVNNKLIRELKDAKPTIKKAISEDVKRIKTPETSSELLQTLKDTFMYQLVAQNRSVLKKANLQGKLKMLSELVYFSNGVKINYGKDNYDLTPAEMIKKDKEGWKKVSQILQDESVLDSLWFPIYRKGGEVDQFGLDVLGVNTEGLNQPSAFFGLEGVEFSDKAVPKPPSKPTTKSGVITSEQSDADRLRGKESNKGKVTSSESIEAKKADIERRRQEELNAKDKQSGERFDSKDEELNTKREAAIILEQNRNDNKFLESDKANEIYDILGEYNFYAIRDGEKTSNNFVSYKDEINAKYDAELAALEQEEAPAEQKNPEDAKRNLFDASPSAGKRQRRIALKRFNSALTTILGDDMDIMSAEERRQFTEDGYEIFGRLSNGKIGINTVNGKVKYTTPRHEIFHWIFNHVISEERYNQITNATKELMMQEAAFKDKLASEITKTDVDEWLAKKYSKLYSGKEFKGVTGIMFKFFNFVKQTIMRMTSQGKQIDDLFRSIERGDYASSGMIYDRIANNELYELSDVIDESQIAIHTPDSKQIDFKNLFGGSSQFARYSKSLLYNIVFDSFFHNGNMSIEEALKGFMLNDRIISKAKVYGREGNLKKEYKKFAKAKTNNINQMDQATRNKYFEYTIANDDILAPILEFLLPGFSFKDMNTQIKSRDSINTAKSRERAFDDSASVQMKLFMNTIKYFNANETSLDDWIPGQFVNEPRARTLIMKAATRLHEKSTSRSLLNKSKNTITSELTRSMKEIANETAIASEDRNILLSVARAFDNLNNNVDDQFDYESKGLSIEEKQDAINKIGLRDRLVSTYLNAYQRNSQNVEFGQNKTERNDIKDNLSVQVQHGIKDSIVSTLFDSSTLSKDAIKKLERFPIVTDGDSNYLSIKVGNETHQIAKSTIVDGRKVYSFINPAQNAEYIISAFQALGMTKNVPRRIYQDILKATKEDNPFELYEKNFLENANSLMSIAALGNGEQTSLQDLLAIALVGSMNSVQALSALKNKLNEIDYQSDKSRNKDIEIIRKSDSYKEAIAALDTLKSGKDFNLNKSMGVDGDFQFVSPMEFWKLFEVLGDITMVVKGSRGEVFNYDFTGIRFLRFNVAHQLASRFNSGQMEMLQGDVFYSNGEQLNFFGRNKDIKLVSIESIKSDTKATNKPETHDYAKLYIESFEDSLKDVGPDGTRRLQLPVLNLADRLDMYAITLNDIPMNEASKNFMKRNQYYRNMHNSSLKRWGDFIEKNGLNEVKAIKKIASDMLSTKIGKGYSEGQAKLFESFVNEAEKHMGPKAFKDAVGNSDLVMNFDYGLDKKGAILSSNDFNFATENFNAETYLKLQKVNYSNEIEAIKEVGKIYKDSIVKEIGSIGKNSKYKWDDKYMQDGWRVNEVTTENGDINPVYLRWFYYNTVVMGDFNDIAFGHRGLFKSSDDRSKRGRTRTTPLERPTTKNKYTWGDNFRIIHVSDAIQDKVTINGKEEVIASDDGGARFTILGYEMLRNSYGGANAPFSDGVQKPGYNGVDTRDNLPLGLKFAAVQTNSELFEMSLSQKRIEFNALDAWSETVNEMFAGEEDFPMPFDAKKMFLKHYNAENRNTSRTVISMMDELESIYDYYFDDIKDQMVTAIVPPGAMKYGRRNINNVDITKRQSGLSTIQLDTHEFGIITNLSADPNTYKKRLAPMNQFNSIVAALNPVIQTEISENLEKIFDLGIEKYKANLNKYSDGGYTGDDALVYKVKRFMRDRALLGMRNTSSDIAYLDLLVDPDVDIKIPSIATKIKQSFRSYVTSEMIRTKYDGLRTTEAASGYTELYRIKGHKRTYTFDEMVRYFGLQNDLEVMPKSFTDKFGDEVEVEVISLSSAEVIDGKVKPSDAIGPYMHKDLFGIQENESLNDFFVIRGSKEDGDFQMIIQDDIDASAKALAAMYKNKHVTKDGSPIIRFLEKTKQTVNVKNIKKAIENYESSLDSMNIRIPTGKAGQSTPAKLIAFVSGLNNTMFFPAGNNLRSDADKDGDQLSTYVKHRDEYGNVIENENTIEGIHNKIIELTYKALDSNPTVWDEISDVSYIVNYEGIEQTENEFVTNGLSESIVNWHKAKAGTDAVGIQANLVTVVNTLLLSASMLPDSLHVFKYGSKETRSKILNYIGDWLQVILDNVQTNTLGNYKISEYAVNLLGTVIMKKQEGNSFDIKVATKNIYDFFTSKEVRDVFNEVEYEKRLESYSSRTPYEIVSSKINNLMGMDSLNPDQIIRLEKLKELKDIISDAEAFRRLSHFTSVRNKIKASDFDYNNYIQNASLYLGMPLKDFVENNGTATWDKHKNYFMKYSNAYKQAKTKADQSALLENEYRIYHNMNTAKLLMGDNFRSVRKQLSVYSDKYLLGKDLQVMFDDTLGYSSIKQAIFDYLSQGNFRSKEQFYNLSTMIDNMIVSEYLNKLPDSRTEFSLIPFQVSENGTLQCPVALNGSDANEVFKMNAKNMDDFKSRFSEATDFILNTLLSTNVSEQEMISYYQSILGKDDGIDYYNNIISPIVRTMSSYSQGGYFKDAVQVVTDRSIKRIAIENLETHQIPQLKTSFENMANSKLKDMFVFYSLIVSKFSTSRYSMAAIVPNSYYVGDYGISSASNSLMDKLNNKKAVNERIIDFIKFFFSDANNLRYIKNIGKTFNALNETGTLPAYAKQKMKKGIFTYEASYDTNTRQSLSPIILTNIYDWNKPKHTISNGTVIKFLSGEQITKLKNGELVEHTFINPHGYETQNVILPGGEVVTLRKDSDNKITLKKTNYTVSKEPVTVKYANSSNISGFAPDMVTLTLDGETKTISYFAKQGNMSTTELYWAAYAQNPAVFRAFFEKAGKGIFEGDSLHVQALNSLKSTFENRNAISEVISELTRSVNSEYAIRMLNDIFPGIEIIPESNTNKKGWIDNKGFHTNVEKISPDLPMHEYGHIFYEYLKENKPDEYDTLIKQASGLIRSGDVLATAIYDHLIMINDKRTKKYSAEQLLGEFIATYAGITSAEQMMLKMAEYNVIESADANAREILENSEKVSKTLSDAIQKAWGEVRTNIGSLKDVKIVKPGVQELFNENPELANQVYEALGFIVSTITPQQKQQALQTYSRYFEQAGKQDIEGFKEFISNNPISENTNVSNNSLIDVFSGMISNSSNKSLNEEMQFALSNMKDNQRWYAQQDLVIDNAMTNINEIKSFLRNEDMSNVNDDNMAKNIYENMYISPEGKLETSYHGQKFSFKYNNTPEDIARVKKEIKETIVKKINAFENSYANNMKDVLNSIIAGETIEDAFTKVFGTGEYNIARESIETLLAANGISTESQYVTRYSELKNNAHPKLRALYDERFIGMDPLIIVHNEGDKPLISILDITSISLKKRPKNVRNNNLLGRLSTNSEFMSNGGTYTNSEGDVRAFSMGLLANNILKNNPGVISDMSVSSLSQTKGLTTISLPDLSTVNANIKAAAMNKPFMDAINDNDIKDIFLNPINYDDFVATRMESYINSVSGAEKYHLEKFFNKEGLTFSEHRDAVVNYINYIKYNNPDSYYSHQGYINASRYLLDITSGVKNSTFDVKDINWLESKIVGMYNVSSKLLQSVKKANDSANTMIRNKMLDAQKEVNEQVNGIINWKRLRDSGLAVGSVLLDNSSKFFDNMYIKVKAKNSKGELVEVNTGELHYNPNDPRTRELLNSNKITMKHIEFANTLMKKFKELQIENFMYKHKNNKNYTKENAETDFKASFGAGNVMPIMNKSVWELLFAKGKGNVKRAAQITMQDISNDAKLFEDVYISDNEKDNNTVSNIFERQSDVDVRNEMLGLRQTGVRYENGIAVKEYEVVDEGLNRSVSTNVYNSFNYFAMSSIRKPILEQEVLPVISAARAIITNIQATTETSLSNLTTFLDRWAARNIDKINADSTADIAIGRKYKTQISSVARGLLRATTFLGLGYKVSVGLKSLAFNTIQQALLGASYSAQNKLSDKVYNALEKGNETMFTAKSWLKAQRMFGLGLDVLAGIPKGTENNFKKYYNIAKRLGIVLSSDLELIESPLMNKSKKHLIQGETAQIANIASDIYSRMVTMVAVMDTEGSLDAYDYDFKTGEVTYDKKKDKRFYTSNGKLKTENGENTVLEMIEENSLREGFQKPMGHDSHLINNIKRVTDKYVIGSMTSDVKPLIGNHWTGALLSQFRLFSFEKLFNAGMFAYERDTISGAGYKAVPDGEGGWIAEQDVIKIEGFWQSAMSFASIFKKGNEMNIRTWWDQASPNRRFMFMRGVNRLATAALVFFAIKATGENEDDWRLKWLWSDLIDSWMVFETAGNPFPAFNFTKNLWNAMTGEEPFRKIMRHIPVARNVDNIDNMIDKYFEENELN
jgi:hypothetical protein